MATNRLMDINELATYLRLEKQTLYNWLHKKKIPGIKMGGVWRFEKRAVDKWLRSHVVEVEFHKKEDKKEDNV